MLEKAVEHYEIAVRLNPEHESAHNNLGIAYNELSDYQKALEHFEAVVGLEPENAEAHVFLGGVYLEQGLVEGRAWSSKQRYGLILEPACHIKPTVFSHASQARSRRAAP